MSTEVAQATLYISVLRIDLWVLRLYLPEQERTKILNEKDCKGSVQPDKLILFDGYAFEIGNGTSLEHVESLLNLAGAKTDATIDDVQALSHWSFSLPSYTMNSYKVRPYKLKDFTFVRLALSQRHDKIPLTLEQAERLYHYDDFLGFLRAFREVVNRLLDPEDFELIAGDMVNTLASQGVRHAEVFITFNHIFRSGTTTVEAAMAAVERARVRGEKEHGITVYWIVDTGRQFGLEQAAIVFNKAVELKETIPSVIGIGIGGDEEGGPVADFAELFAKAKKAGLRITAHAGEAVPAFSVWDALAAGAERIGHGLTAVSDPKLVQELKQRQTPVELCVTSNVCTGGIKSPRQHPIRTYYDAGLLISINTDDPPMFRTTLLDEYELVQKEFAFSNEDMIELARKSVRSSFLPPERKGSLIEELDHFPLPR
ncbi:hypothetical protein PRZ48_011419 [Zasmidium cellare]|uniref:Adenosine deaminase n=1 Tax=Zasmidium cellare TaxID=395010 RepID=A0ABR0E699_ZASCE|nr:hypothetical protein PRZ48_011419 [Zasmidium cellare]